MKRVHERATLWLLHTLTKRPAAAKLNACIVRQSKRHTCNREGTVTSNCEAVTYLFETCWTDEIIAATDAVIKRLTQPSNKSPMEYPKHFWNKSLRFHLV